MKDLVRESLYLYQYIYLNSISFSGPQKKNAMYIAEDYKHQGEVQSLMFEHKFLHNQWKALTSRIHKFYTKIL